MIIDTDTKTIVITGPASIKEVLDMVDKFNVWDFKLVQESIPEITTTVEPYSFNWTIACTKNFNQIRYIQTV